MIKFFKSAFPAVSADEIMAPLVSTISRLYSVGAQHQEAASTKRDEADELLLEAATAEREAERCLKFATKLDEFLK